MVVKFSDLWKDEWIQTVDTCYSDSGYSDSGYSENLLIMNTLSQSHESTGVEEELGRVFEGNGCHRIL